MIDFERVSEESETAGRLAAMSRHISVTAIEATLRLLHDPDSAASARRVAAVSQHIATAAAQMAVSVEAERVAAAFDTAQRPIAV